jgi:cytochrome c oxidase subunit 3/cytochrome o ubiquinol oxidase subunit 3
MATIEQAPPSPPTPAEPGHGGPPVHPPTNTGTTNTKLAIWLFLSSDCLFFGAFISAYLLYRGRHQTGPTPAKVYSIPFTSVSSFVLLMSSMTMVLALAAIQRGDLRRLRIWLLSTALLGTVFIGGQIFEFTEFARKGLHLDTNLFSSTFFVLTGFHGAHVTIGIIWLLSLWGLATQGRLHQGDAEKIEIAGLYWHFVDVVWIVIFTVVYLIPAAK